MQGRRNERRKMEERKSGGWRDGGGSTFASVERLVAFTRLEAEDYAEHRHGGVVQRGVVRDARQQRSAPRRPIESARFFFCTCQKIQITKNTPTKQTEA